MQDPEVHLAALGVTLPDALDTARPAVLDVAHRARIGHDTFFFGDLETKAAFEVDPLPGCGKLTDPVTGDRFRPDAASPTAILGDRRYFFASDTSRDRFLENPAEFADAKRAMPEAAGR